MNKKDLSERDICTKFITPGVVKAGWDIQWQIREEVGFTRGRIIVRGKLVTRGKAQRADYVGRRLRLALTHTSLNNHFSTSSKSALGMPQASRTCCSVPDLVITKPRLVSARIRRQIIPHILRASLLSPDFG